ncbi:MAG: M15 family metallopeptidase [Halobacteriovoraceae bacterium]|nr:M15 family metallopeptidase [Halobacteriovoraceae bacterium]MCB9093895.1 M15 family metallopeptidase [Halobacteriovoraceae bacterium]
MDYLELTGRTDSHLTKVPGTEFLIYTPILDDFLDLQDSATKELIDLRIVSSYRNLDYQLKIWSEKAEGKRDLYNRDGKKLKYSQLNEEQILSAILNFTTLPGSSRHHWGTDLDLYDHTEFKNTDQKLLLINNEYEKGGPCFHLRTFMDNNKIFYRPFASDNLPISRELWHYSHRSESLKFQKSYTFEIFKRNIQEIEFPLKELIVRDLARYYQHCTSVSMP